MKNIQTIVPKKSSGLLKQVYDDIQSIFPGAVAPLYEVHSNNSTILSAYWESTKQVYLSGKLPRIHREVIALGVSETNTCPFCIEAHGNMIKAGSKEIGGVIKNINGNSLEGKVAKDIYQWSKSTLNPDAIGINKPVYIGQLHTEMVGVATLFHYINRFTNVFLEDSMMPVPETLGLRKMVTWLVRPMMRKFLKIEVDTNNSDSTKEIPAPLLWTRDAPHISEIYTKWYDIMLEVQKRNIPKPISDILFELLDQWNGNLTKRPMNWINIETQKVPEKLRPAMELVLLTAFSSYKVTPELIERVRKEFKTDAEIFSLVSWSAYFTSLKIANWL